MNGTRESVSQLLSGLLSALAAGSMDDVEIVVCPAFVFLEQTVSQIGNAAIGVGVQNVSDQLHGAHTGEISISMALEFGCKCGIVGHSERRTLYQESDDFIARKFELCIESGLKPILCVGETESERGKGLTDEVVREQVGAVLSKAGIAAFENVAIAYEPVWAIGTGRTPENDEVEQVHQMIRQILAAESQDVASSVRILYGGSVNPDNAKGLFSQANVDGGLVGGASLDAHSFIKICQLAGS